MASKPILGNIELQQVQNIEVDEDQVLTHHAVPALEGDFLQGLGRRANRISLNGVLTGLEAGERLNTLREKFRAAEPLPFVADIATATQVGQVIVEEMSVRDLAGKPERFEYAFLLREYIEPPPTTTEPPPEIETPPPISVDSGILIVEVIVEGRPGFDYSTVIVTVEGTQEDGSTLPERTLTNRTNNIWTEDEFPPGQYTVKAVVTEPEAMNGSVSATVQAGQTEEVTITLRPGVVIAKFFAVHFWFDKAFVEPCMRAVLRQVAQYAQDHSDEKLVIVGHTDMVGDRPPLEPLYNQSLSERRGRSIYAYLTFGRDQAGALSEWDQLRRARITGVLSINDTWGVRQYQYILQELGYYSDNVDGNHGPQTDGGVRRYQGDKGLMVNGVVGDDTWAALIEDYIGRDNLAVPESQFLQNAYNGCDDGILKWLGCGELDPVRETEDAWRPNRRTELLFVRDSVLPARVRKPDTFELPPPSGVGTTWCLGDSTTRTRTCFVQPHLLPRKETCSTAPLGTPWIRINAEPGNITVRGSIRFEDGTPAANLEYILIAPDGEYMDGERPRGANRGRPISARTDAEGNFAYPEKPKGIGVYTLEIKGAYVVRREGDPIEAAKGNVVCKRLDGTSDFDVIMCRIATTFDLQVSNAIQIGGTNSTNYLAIYATTGYVIVTAVFPTGTCAAPHSITWTGGEEVPGNRLQRRVTLSTTGQTTVNATMTTTGETRSVDIFVVRVTLDVDADRDGVVADDEEGKNGWEFGVGRKGAVILCNNDNDNRFAGDSQIDNENRVVDGTDDVSDLATLIIRQSGPLPPGVNLILAADDQSKIRVFDQRNTSGADIVGPAPLPVESPPIVSSIASDVELGMEATQYPDATFNGLIQLILTLREGATEHGRDEVWVRVAPWVMPSHRDITEEVYVVENVGYNDSFVSGIQAAATAAGVPLKRANAATYLLDQWMQDTMEVGYSHIPGKTISTILQAHRDRGLQNFARNELLDRDYGYTEESVLSPTVSPPHNTFDSHGNLEVSPPIRISTTGENFQFGRIYYGRGRPATPFNSDIKTFIEAQLVQKPFDIDTDWLGVGHVDEIISFIPSNVGNNFRMLFADTNEAIRILTDLQTAGHGSLTLFTGKTIPYLRPLVSPGRSPDSYDHFHERSIDNILSDGALIAGNSTCQTRLNAVQTRLEAELGLDPDTDIIKIPSLFIEEPLFPGTFAALIPGMVNLLVITRPTFANTQLVIPDPFGPVLSGEDNLKRDVRDKLTALGYYTLSQIRFVDDFDTYHINLGEVHCGTNSKRRPPAIPWWEQTDF